MQVERGRIFRDAWIAGVKKHFPGEPKPSYITPWEETPDWEREAATAVYDQVHAFITATGGATAKLTRGQKAASSPSAGSARFTGTSPTPACLRR